MASQSDIIKLLNQNLVVIISINNSLFFFLKEYSIHYKVP